MKIIKLDAIDSTSTFLKNMCKEKDVGNFTVVVAKNQIKGRGQMGSVWSSEINKNLTFSILTNFELLEIKNQFMISKVVSLAVYDTISTLLSTNISIKWPNDILAEKQKICGILIENSVKKTKIKHSIIGIGLNVNQTAFKNLPNATSMKLISGKDFNLDTVLNTIVVNIKKYIAFLNTPNFELIDSMYLKRLFRVNIPTMFCNAKGTIFKGKIMGVSVDGKLQVELKNKVVYEFNLKEIKLVKFS